MKYLKLIIIGLLFYSCQESKKVENETLPDSTISDTIIDEVVPQEIDAEKSYSISVETIDSVAFYQAKKNAPRNKPIEKITDFEIAKKRLAGIVEFSANDEYGEYQAVRKINFRNGTNWGNANDFDGEFFVAYFPSEDILLCEGGHTTDVSFNLKNGKQTEETGNPDVIVTSPNKLFRLNGHFGGQECYSYFLQKKINGEFEKILQLDEEFKKITKIWLCSIGESFWTDDSTLFVTENNYAGPNGKAEKKYFKILLK